ncbi:MAG: sugar phosphate isomerase/epimerase [Acetobacteraceae bacterium]|nr:sugar phosphate isomerase/epimerase [Acetobacteraceae bacterium]
MAGFLLSSEEILSGAGGAPGLKPVGVEVGRLRGRDAARRVREFLSGQPPSFIVGLHMPLLLLQGVSAPPVVSADPERRRAGREEVARLLDQAVEWGAAYVLLHFPAPPVLPRARPQWPWRLTDWEPRELQGPTAVAQHSREFCGWLEEEAARRGLKAYLEGDGPHPHFYRTGLMARLLAEHPGLGFCLNVGQLHLLARLGGFSFEEAVEALAPFTAVLHLNNSRHGPQVVERMVPVHPSQDPAQGWADVPAVVRAVVGVRPDCLLKFEQEGVWAEARLVEGRLWVQSLVAGAEPPLGQAVSRWLEEQPTRARRGPRGRARRAAGKRGGGRAATGPRRRGGPASRSGRGGAGP